MENNNFIWDNAQLEQEINNNPHKKLKKNGCVFSFFEKEEKDENQKYFVHLKKEEEEEYIGVLNKNFKKELFGYSLFNQGDEFLGEIFNEKKHGFGIYKFKIKEKEFPDFYIGNFSDNKINGEGIYINILDQKKEPKGRMDEIILIKYNCYIGHFENGEFKQGKIYTFSEDCEILNLENENNKISIEKRKDIILVNKEITKNEKLYEGIIISINNDGVEEKFSYQTLDNSKYNFTNLDDKDSNVQELFEDFKKSKFEEYKEIIEKLVNQIEDKIYRFKRNFDYAKALGLDKKSFDNILNNLL